MCVQFAISSPVSSDFVCGVVGAGFEFGVGGDIMKPQMLIAARLKFFFLFLILCVMMLMVVVLIVLNLV